MRRSLADEVREQLISEIIGGVFPVGSRLPAEPELAARYAVSRPTIRETVRGLVDSGYVQRRHGTGTFVTARPRRRNSLEVTVSAAAMIRAAGMEPGERILDARLREALPAELAALSLPPDGIVVALERVKTADGAPAIYSRDAIRADILPDVDPQDIRTSLYDFLEFRGINVLSAFTTLHAEGATARIAGNLAIADGTAVMRLEQIDYDQSGQPVIFSIEWHAPNIFELCVNRRRTSTTGWTTELPPSEVGEGARQ